MHPRRRSRTIVALAAATGALLLAGCGASTPDQPAESTVASPTPSSMPSPAATSAAPTPTAAQVPAVLQFTASTVDGGRFDGASLAGKDTVLFFWAPWCVICRREAPDVAAAAAAAGDTVAFVGVAGLSRDVPAMRRFVTDTGLGVIPNLDDSRGELYTRFEVTEQSTFVVVDGTTGEMTRVTDELDAAGLSELVDRLAA